MLKEWALNSTQLNSIQPDITDAGVNTSISASMYPTFLKT